MKKIPSALAVWLAPALLLGSSTSIADASRVDDHAPIGVMGDHTHKKGEWMFSYRFMQMTMEDNREGTNRLDESEVLLNGTGQYRVAPTEMTMNMHMLGVMYAPTDSVTLMAMIPYIDNEMDHVTAMDGAFTTKSSHLGDVSISALSSFDNGTIWQLGLSIPTGDQDQRDLTPLGNAVLPYPMQIGSGTYDLIAGLGRNFQRDDDSYGVQAKMILRLGENDDDYAISDVYSLTGWYAHRVNQHWSVSVRGAYEHRTNYDDSDPRYAGPLASNLIPTVDPDLRGGDRFDMAVGVNWMHASGHRIAFEYQVPLWQDLDGPQLETDNIWTVGWQRAF